MYHRPILINLQDPELALGEQATIEGAFANVAALGILLANRRLGARLRHAGVRVVVSTSADPLALEAVEVLPGDVPAAGGVISDFFARAAQISRWITSYYK